MIPCRNEKVQNAVAYFAEQHRKKSKRYLYQTFLYKYLAFLDFYSLKETGRPALDLVYKAMKKGPVPIEIYEHKTETPKYKFVKDEWGEFVVAKGKPDLDYFSPYEINLMDRLLEIFARKWVTSTQASDSSHERIKAWQRTWAQCPNGIIDPALEFEGDLFRKKEDQLSYSEEVYLTYRALKNIEC
jgi:uncharacterized phage-associated protein